MLDLIKDLRKKEVSAAALEKQAKAVSEQSARPTEELHRSTGDGRHRLYSKSQPRASTQNLDILLIFSFATAESSSFCQGSRLSKCNSLRYLNELKQQKAGPATESKMVR